MTEDRLIPRRAAWIATAMTGMLQACANQQPSPPTVRVYAADLAGAAKTCEVPRISPADGQTTEAAIKLANDGGWCGLPVRHAGGPFDAGLLSERPAHGAVMIHQVGDDTRVDYTPDRGFTGTDSFAVKLVPGNASLRINVTVMAPGSKA